MDIDDIIIELAADDGFPRQTVRYCLDHPEEVVPVFVSILTRAADDQGVSPAEFDALFLIVHILGDLKEPQAYRPLVELLRKDRDTLEELFGDAITETMPQVMISVFDGDPEPLHRLIDDVDADEFAREVGLVAWTRWAIDGGVSRDDARDQLRAWFEMLQPKKDNNIWSAWIDAVAALRLPEFNEAVREVIEGGRLPVDTMDYGHYEHLMSEASEEPEEFLRHRRMMPFTDIIGVLSQWHGYSEAAAREQRRREVELAMAMRIENPFRHVGRNDLCPCGSGKKFKKCCLH